MTELDAEPARRAIVEHTRRLAESAAAAGPDAAVPTTPEWTITDLVQHVGQTQHWVAKIRRNEHFICAYISAWSENRASAGRAAAAGGAERRRLLLGLGELAGFADRQFAGSRVRAEGRW